MRCKLLLAPVLVGVVALCATPDTSAQQSSVVTFDTTSFGWHWTGSEWTEVTGGNPDAFLHGHDELLVCYAWAYNRTTYTGNYAAGGLASLGIDLTVFAWPTEHAYPVTLMLIHDNGTPSSFGDDWGAYHVGPVDLPQPGQGWRSYDVQVAAQENSLPPGWTLWHTTTHTWSELMQDVSEVRFALGQPIDQCAPWGVWDVGMDNARFTLGEPGRVPPDVRLARVSDQHVNVTWSAPGGCGHPEDYAIYEGTLGDWTSHVPVVCTDEMGDLQERITASPGNRYYLVVPLGSATEGSYGLDSVGQERPPALGCRAAQSLACS